MRIYTAALEQKDHAVSQVYVIDTASRKIINPAIPDFKGHVNWAGWKDTKTIYYQQAKEFGTP